MKIINGRTIDGPTKTFIYGKRDITWKSIESHVDEEMVVINGMIICLDHGTLGFSGYHSVWLTPADNPTYYMETHRFNPGKVDDPKGTSRGFFENIVAEYKNKEKAA
jgi:hypothetical protein